MANINQSPKYVARLGRHGHDLSRRVLFTSSTGHLLPVLKDFLSPGDSIRINSDLFTRTQPLLSAAFIRCTEHIDYFFVPVKQLDPYWEQSFFGISDYTNANDMVGYSSSANVFSVSGSNRLPHYVPTISPSQLKMAFLRSSNGMSYREVDGVMSLIQPIAAAYDDMFGIPKLFNAIRLMDLLGFGSMLLDSNFANNYISSFTSIDSNAYLAINPIYLQAYQKIYADYYRLSDFESCIPVTWNNGRARLLNNNDDGQLTTTNYWFNRDLQYFYTSSYNGLFMMRYHPQKRDFFTNIKPTPLFDVWSNPSGGFQGLLSTVSSVQQSIYSNILSPYGVQLQSLTQGFNAMSNANVQLSNAGESNAGEVSLGTGDTTSNPNTSFELPQLRMAYAFERMLAITQRAGKHYNDQVKAHFGVNVPRGVSDEVYYLGSHSTRMQIGEVLATSDSSNGDTSSVLGQIGGRGLSASSNRQKTIRFTAPCHGILMAIYSAVPDVDYRDTGVDRLNLIVTPNQFPRPEYDDLGMQPLYFVQGYAGYFSTGLSPNLFIGWQYRYSEFKQSYDVVHGAFNYTLGNWVAMRFMGDYTTNIASVSYNYLPNLYVSPTYFDNIFALTFALPSATGFSNFKVIQTRNVYINGSNVPEVGSTPFGSADVVPRWNSSVVYERDPFLHSLDFKYYKTSFMSTYGLPNL